MTFRRFASFTGLWQAPAVCLLILATTLIPGIPSVHAQTLTTGDITGILADPTGAVIPGATVTLRGVDTGS